MPIKAVATTDTARARQAPASATAGHAATAAPVRAWHEPCAMVAASGGQDIGMVARIPAAAIKATAMRMMPPRITAPQPPRPDSWPRRQVRALPLRRRTWPFWPPCASHETPRHGPRPQVRRPRLAAVAARAAGPAWRVPCRPAVRENRHAWPGRSGRTARTGPNYRCQWLRPAVITVRI
jgi:hypothetical protein